MAIGDRIVYTNNSVCGRFPEKEEIFRKIREHGGSLGRSSSYANRGGDDSRSESAAADAGCVCSAGSCCPLPSGGGSAETDPSLSIDTSTGGLAIDFLYLDLGDCGRCRNSDSGLDEAVAGARPVLASLGIDITVNKIHVQTEEQARALEFVSSPTIRINGADIAPEIQESLCEGCGDLCGDQVNCREWVYKGRTYTAAPKAMILDAIFRAIYIGAPANPQAYEDVPQNLKHFFKAREKKAARVAAG